MQLFKLTSQKLILNEHISLFNVESIQCSLDRYVVWYMLDIKHSLTQNERSVTEWCFPQILNILGKL